MLRFNELNLSKELSRAIDDMEFERPSEVQEATIPYILQGNDILAQAQTGTGKTTSFGIPMIEKIQDKQLKSPQGLVLVPTRELMRQVTEGLKELAKYRRFIELTAIYGGADMGKRLSQFRNGTSIAVGTPGRIMGHMKRKNLQLDQLEFLVLDEADEMFDMGLRDDMKTIIEKTNPNRQTLFFFATFDNNIKDFSKLYQDKPKKVILEKKELTAGKIHQCYLELNRNMKTEILNRLLLIHRPNKSIIFCNAKEMVDSLEVEMAQKGYQVVSLHGDMKQSPRDQTMKKFRDGSIDLLIATDVAARGLDVSDIDLVFSYDLPQQFGYYVHRIGRTARAGKKGVSFTFVANKNYDKFREIEDYANIKIDKMGLPTKKDVGKEGMESLYERVNKSIVPSADQEEYTGLLSRLLGQGHSLYDIGASLLKMVNQEANNVTLVKLDKVDFGKKSRLSRSKKSGNFGKKSKKDWGNKKIQGPKISINKGKGDGVDSGEVIRLIRRYTDVATRDIGRVNIMPNFTFVEIPKSKIKKAIKGLSGRRTKGKPSKAEHSEK